jgi:hypothetical protein
MIMRSTTTGDSGLIKLLCVRMQLLEFPSLHAHILCPLLSLPLCLFFSFSCILSSLYVYVIVCFTLDVNCEERRRSSNVRRVYTREEELTRNKRGKERTINLKERKRSPILFLSSSSSSLVCSQDDRMCYTDVKLNQYSKSHLMY